MWKDPTSVWGKNKPLEKFWQGLVSDKYVVVIYTNGKHQYVKPPKSLTKKSNNFYNNKEIEAVLSQDAYEIHLYPKAKDESVEHVIKNFKSFGVPSKDLIESGSPLMKKVRVPS